MPLTLVAMGLKPLVLLPGFGSNMSMWLGPPGMNSKMQLLCFGLPCEVSAACMASRLSQPEAGRLKAPTADNFNHSRRERELESICALDNTCRADLCKPGCCAFDPVPHGTRLAARCQ